MNDFRMIFDDASVTEAKHIVSLATSWDVKDTQLLFDHKLAIRIKCVFGDHEIVLLYDGGYGGRFSIYAMRDSVYEHITVMSMESVMYRLNMLIKKCGSLGE